MKLYTFSLNIEVFLFSHFYIFPSFTFHIQYLEGRDRVGKRGVLNHFQEEL